MTQRLHSVRPGRRSRRSIALLAVSTGLAGLVGTVAGGPRVGAIGSADASEIGSHSAESSVPGEAPPIDIEFEIDMMLGLVPDDEVNDYFNRQGSENEKLIQTCMNEAGFTYNVITNFEVQGPPTGAEEQLEWARQWGFGRWTTMNPDDNPWSGRDADVSADPNEFVADLPEGEQNAWYETLARCSTDVWDSSAVSTWSNPMVLQAMEDFETWVENDPRMRDARDAWSECMLAAGQPFADEEAMFDAVWGDDPGGTLQNQLYESEAWSPESPDHEQWQGLVDTEIAIAVANAECAVALDEVRAEVQLSLRPRLVEAWQDVDWDLPAVSYPGYEVFPADSAPASGDSAPDDTVVAPTALDLGDPSESAPA